MAQAFFTFVELAHIFVIYLPSFFYKFSTEQETLE